jgi:hypothetical protein
VQIKKQIQPLVQKGIVPMTAGVVKFASNEIS